MSPWILVPFAIGTLAFLATLYLAIFVPQASDTPWPQEANAEPQEASAEEHPLRRWDTVITWLMWGGWGIAMLMRFLDRNDLIDRLIG